MNLNKTSYKYIKPYLNEKTGAVVGGLVGLVGSTIILTTNPQLKELPIEEKIQGVVFATGLFTLGYAIWFDISRRIFNGLEKYHNNKQGIESINRPLPYKRRDR